MGKRYYIHVGDATTNGGIFTTGLVDYTVDGYICSFEGDLIACPKCKSTGVIRCAGPRMPQTGPHGREEALDGDLCICGCFPPPRLIASQSDYSTHDGSSSADGGSGECAVSDWVRETGEMQFGLPPTDGDGTHDQGFLICDTETGEPVPKRLYRLTYSGGILQGRTDAQGHTQRVARMDAETVQIEIFAEGV